MRFLSEDPWERLAALRQAIPNICLLMLLRGRNTVGYTPYPTDVTDAFVEAAAATGIDVFRIFDALNDVEQMRPAIEAVRRTGTTIAEVALCYTGDLSNPDEKLYTLGYYLCMAERIVEAGAQVLAIKDMAGLLRAPAARTLVTALRARFDLPIHLPTHDTTGGQLSNLRQQAVALGLGEKFEQIEDMYDVADDILGHIVKVTPVLESRRRPRPAPGGGRSRPGGVRRHPGKFDIPDSVIGFLNGELGDPPGGWPEPFRTKALEGRTWKAPGQQLTNEQAEGLSDGPSARRRRILNELLFPGPTRDIDESRETYGDLSVLPTMDYLHRLRFGEEHQVDLAEGIRLIVGLQAISEPDERGYRTVMATINGHLHPISVQDHSVATNVAVAEKADPRRPGQVAAPFQGVVTIAVDEGQRVSAGDPVATIEAMKMEASITAPIDGTVRRIAVARPKAVDGGDLILVLD